MFNINPLSLSIPQNQTTSSQETSSSNLTNILESTLESSSNRNNRFSLEGDPIARRNYVIEAVNVKLFDENPQEIENVTFIDPDELVPPPYIEAAPLVQAEAIRSGLKIGQTPETIVSHEDILRAKLRGVQVVHLEELLKSEITPISEGSPRSLAISVIEHLYKKNEFVCNPFFQDQPLLIEAAKKSEAGKFRNISSPQTTRAQEFILTINDQPFLLYTQKRVKLNLEFEEDSSSSGRVNKKRKFPETYPSLDKISNAIKETLRSNFCLNSHIRERLDMYMDNFQHYYRENNRNPQENLQEKMADLLDKINNELEKPELFELRKVYQEAFNSF